MAIYDTMQLIAPTCRPGRWGSPRRWGQFLLSSAPGKRYALPHTKIVMHQPVRGIGGTASDIAIQAAQYSLTKRRWPS
jgi:ATP-dependent Clp protease protease subunit